MRRVVKLGGSLLIRDDVVERLRRWYAAQPEAETLLIVGGGELINAIRHLDRVHPGEPAEVHWRCVDLLQVTFELVREWFPGWGSITGAEAFDRQCREGFALDRPTLVSVRAFYRRGAGAGLPEDWSTTTDAISAYLARRTSADELVLLKSCEVDSAAGLRELAARGIVDPAFPAAAKGVPRVSVRKLSFG